MRAFLLSFLLVGCAHRPAGNDLTAPARGHLELVQDNLSRVDGKAAVVESWLRSH